MRKHSQILNKINKWIPPQGGEKKRKKEGRKKKGKGIKLVGKGRAEERNRRRLQRAAISQPHFLLSHQTTHFARQFGG
jgi:hypothetical protein